MVHPGRHRGRHSSNATQDKPSKTPGLDGMHVISTKNVGALLVGTSVL